MKTEKLMISDFKKKYRGLQIIRNMQKIHPSLSHSLKIGYQSIEFSKDKLSQFWVFANDEYVGYPLSFPSDIHHLDISLIANEIVEIYIESCNLQEIIDESNGIVPCDEKKGIQKTCDNCPEYRPNDGECIGPMWTMPSIINLYEIERKWDAKYGKGSKAEQAYCYRQIKCELNQFLFRYGNDSEMMLGVLEYIAKHSRFEPHIEDEKLKGVLLEITNKNNLVLPVFEIMEFSNGTWAVICKIGEPFELVYKHPKYCGLTKEQAKLKCSGVKYQKIKEAEILSYWELINN